MIESDRRRRIVSTNQLAQLCQRPLRRRRLVGGCGALWRRRRRLGKVLESHDLARERHLADDEIGVPLLCHAAEATTCRAKLADAHRGLIHSGKARKALESDDLTRERDLADDQIRVPPLYHAAEATSCRAKLADAHRGDRNFLVFLDC